MSERLQQGQPMIIMDEDAQRVSDRNAQDYNIQAARAVAKAVRSTLGPKGMDKMLVDSMGDVIITNDGVTILDKMDIDNPTAEMIVEVAETQKHEAGDGTTTAVTIAGELLKNAQGLIDQDVHPTTIAQGYRQAAEKAKGILEENAIDVSEDDRDTLRKIAETAMTGTGAESSKDLLAELVVDAVVAVKDDAGIDIDNVSVQKVVGGSIDNSELVEGVIMDKKRAHENMPFGVEDANVALFDGALEVRETEIDTEVSVTDPDQLQQFLDREEKQLKKMVNRLVDIGADVIFVGDGIDDIAQHHLAKEGLLAVHSTNSSDLNKLARATGGKIVGSPDDIETDDLGFAGSVAQKNIGGDERIFVEDIEDVKSVTLILCGGTDHVVDELERAIDDSLGVIKTILEDDRALPGGGAPEVEVALQLRQFAGSVGGREQLAVEAFADAVDIIPRTLAENAGFNAIDSLVDLRAKHTQSAVSDETADDRSSISPAEISSNPEYFTEIFILAEIGGLGPDEIREQVDDAEEKSKHSIEVELGSIHFHLREDRFDKELAQELREIEHVKQHLADYCKMIQDSDDSIESLSETLSEEEFRSQVDTYVEDAITADKELGYEVDQVTRWFYRKKQECYLKHRYNVDLDDEFQGGVTVGDTDRDYHNMFSQASSQERFGPKYRAGIDAHSVNIADMVSQGVLEPLRVKTEALESATQAAVMILKIDDIIAADELSTSSDDERGAPSGGMGGGMGGAM